MYILHCICSYVCILFAFISHFLKLVVYMLGYVPYITTWFTDFGKPVLLLNEEKYLKSVFGLLLSRTLTMQFDYI